MNFLSLFSSTIMNLCKEKKNLFWELSILKVIKYSVFLHAWNSSFWMELHLKGMHLESKIWFLKSINTHTMMLLMGMWIKRTKNPINPMMANPIAVAIAIFWNSNLEKRKNWLGYILSYSKQTFNIWQVLTRW